MVEMRAPLSRTFPLLFYEQGKLESLMAETFETMVRVHLGYTIRCFLLLFGFLPVRSSAYGFL
jgi:hypothetical protein